MVNLQKCCCPIPGDTIVAMPNKNKGLEVHRDDCVVLPRIGPSHNKEIFSIAWVDDVGPNSFFIAAVKLKVHNRIGVLSLVTDSLKEMDVNIEEMHISGDNEMKDMYFLIKVRDMAHLQSVMASLKTQSQVLDVERVFDKRHL